MPPSPLQVLWPYLLEFVTPVQFTSALTPLCKSLMHLAMKKQEEGEAAVLIHYDANRECLGLPGAPLGHDLGLGPGGEKASHASFSSCVCSKSAIPVCPDHEAAGELVGLALALPFSA